MQGQNINRNCKIYDKFAYHLIDDARRVCANDDFEVKVDGNVYAFDSTTIDLCLSVFWWAEFRKKKGGVKMYTLYDVKTQIPSFVHITAASVNDVNAMDNIPYEKGSYYIFDKGYNDFERLFKHTKYSKSYSRGTSWWVHMLRILTGHVKEINQKHITLLISGLMVNFWVAMLRNCICFFPFSDKSYRLGGYAPESV